MGSLPWALLAQRRFFGKLKKGCVDHECSQKPLFIVGWNGNTETANKDGTWLREISSCCCLTTAGKTRQLLLNNIYIPFLPSLYADVSQSVA